MKIFLVFSLVCAISSVVSKKNITSINFKGLQTLHQILCRKDFYMVFIYDEHGIFTIYQLSFTERPVSIILYNNAMIHTHEGYMPIAQIDAFIMFTSYKTQVKDVTLAISDTHGIQSPWKSISPFYVINGYEYKCDSELAINTLLNLFIFNSILESYFIYLESNETSTMVFTFNPYFHDPPGPWIRIISDQLFYRTTSFSRSSTGDICRNLYFDRIKGHLEDCVIHVAVRSLNQSTPPDVEFYSKNNINLVMDLKEQIYVESLAIALKVKIKYTFFDPTDKQSRQDTFENCAFDVIVLLGFQSETISVLKNV